MKKGFSLSLLLFFISSLAFAQTNPREFNFSGQLTDSLGNPVLNSSITLTLKIMSSSGSCLLYEESQLINTSASNGYFNVGIGSAVGAAKRTSNDSGNTMSNIFRNAGTITGAGSCTYTPAAGDTRQLVVTVDDGVTVETLSAQTIRSVPTAFMSENSERVGGLAPSSLLQVNTTGVNNLTQSNLENIFTSTNYTTLNNLLAGTSNLYNRPATNGTNTLPSLTSPSTPSAGQIWYNAGNIYYHDGSATRTVSTGAGGVTSFNSRTGAIVPQANDYTWAQIDKSTSSLADLGTRNAADLTGTLADARLSGNVPFLNSNNTFTGTNFFNVGNQTIQTGAPANNALVLRGASSQTAPLMVFQNSASTTLHVISEAGVGIGTTFPARPLQVNGAMRLTPTVTPGSPAVGDIYMDSTTYKLRYYDNSSWVDIEASAGGGGDFMASGTIPMTGNFRSGGNWISNDGDAEGIFVTTTGRVGVGTSNPGTIFEVVGSNASMQTVNVKNTNASGTNFFSAQNDSNSSLLMGVTGTGFTSSGIYQQNHAVIYSDQFLSGLNIGTENSSPISFWTNNTERVRISQAGNIGIGTTAPSATLHLKPGAAATGSAPLKLTSGTILTTPEVGAIEFDGTNLYFTDNTLSRKTVGVAGTGILALNGDINAVGSGTVSATINNGVVTSAKIADGTIAAADIADGAVSLNKLGNIPSSTVIGRTTAGAGQPETLSLDSFSTANSVVYRDASGNFQAGNIISTTTRGNSLQLYNGGSTVSLVSPVAANYTLTVPQNGGSNNQVLKTDGSGVTSWTDMLSVVSLTTSGEIRAGGGTFSNPGIGFTNDMDTGIYSTAAGQMTLASNGYDAITIMQTGANARVGIGTTSPAVTNFLEAKLSPSASAPRSIDLNGQGTAGSVPGGNVKLYGGPSTSTGAGGDVQIFGGSASSTGNAGAVSILAGNAMGVSNSAGHLNLSGGSGGGTNNNGGNINITAGDRMGSGIAGNVNIVTGNAGIGRITINTAASSGFSKMGTCTNMAVTIGAINTWSAFTCTGAPAATDGNVVVSCSQYSATPAQISCRAHDTFANNVHCTSSATLTSAKVTCMWMLQ